MSRMAASIRAVLQPRGGVAVADNSQIVVGSPEYLQEVLKVAEENYENACDEQLEIRSKPSSDVEKANVDNLVISTARAVSEAQAAVGRYIAQQQRLEIEYEYDRMKKRAVALKKVIDEKRNLRERILYDELEELGREFNALLRAIPQMEEHYPYLKG